MYRYVSHVPHYGRWLQKPDYELELYYIKQRVETIDKHKDRMFQFGSTAVSFRVDACSRSAPSRTGQHNFDALRSSERALTRKYSSAIHLRLMHLRLLISKKWLGFHSVLLLYVTRKCTRRTSLSGHPANGITKISVHRTRLDQVYCSG